MNMGITKEWPKPYEQRNVQPGHAKGASNALKFQATQV
jgi:hypothetical protein